MVTISAIRVNNDAASLKQVVRVAVQIVASNHPRQQRRGIIEAETMASLMHTRSTIRVNNDAASLKLAQYASGEFIDISPSASTTTRHH